MKPKTTIKIEEINSFIRQGDTKNARSLLDDVITSRDAKDYILPISALARRLDEPSIGIRILHPLVRNAVHVKRKATERELAEYAACLAQSGIPDEALSILEGLNESENAEVLLFRAFAHIAKWDYDSAVPELERYIRSDQVRGYRRLVGLLNLGGAKVVISSHQEAKVLLEEVIHSSQEFPYIRSVAEEYAAQSAIACENWDEATHLLEGASTELVKTSNLQSLFVQKWQAVLLLLREKDKHKGVKKINQVRLLALKKRHWETARQIDYYIAKATQDRTLYAKLYFGTPHKAFRQRLISEFSKTFSIPQHYQHEIGPTDSKSTVFEVVSGLLDGVPAVRPGDIVHRGLLALVSDLYRPLRLATLHANIYEAEYFNPDTSPLRVHQCLTSIRKWATKNKFSLTIENDPSGFRLESRLGCYINIGLRVERDAHNTGMVSRIRSSFGEKMFTSSELANLLNTSIRNANRVLKELIADQSISVTGFGRATRYQISQKQK